MRAIHPGPPQAGEFMPFYAGYIAKAGSIEDPVARLATQLSEVTSFLSGIDHRKRLYRYAPGKIRRRSRASTKIPTHRPRNPITRNGVNWYRSGEMSGMPPYRFSGASPP